LSACIGGGSLILAPSGEILKMPLSLLEYSPFTDFFIPGIILFTVIGIGSLVISFLAIKHVNGYPLYIILSGTALFIWIMVQMIMIRGIHFLHIFYAIIGIILTFFGFIIKKQINH